MGSDPIFTYFTILKNQVMKILVVGGAGYIGSHCVLQIIQAGHDPVVRLSPLSSSDAYFSRCLFMSLSITCLNQSRFSGVELLVMSFVSF